MSATTVLPDRPRPAAAGASAPGAARSPVISAIARCLVVGERERQRGVERGHERAVDDVRDARSRSPPSARLRATSPSCMRRNSSNFSRCAAAQRVGHATRDGGCRGTRVVRSTRSCSARTDAVERIGEAARLRALEARRDRAAQLPGVHLGLPRLRVHRHDRAGDVAAAASASASGARARRRPGSSSGACRGTARPCRTTRPACRAAAGAPASLVEEHDLEQAGAVVDRRRSRSCACRRASAARASSAPRRRPSPRRRSRAPAISARSCGRRSGAGSARAGRAPSRCPSRRGPARAWRRPRLQLGDAAAPRARAA